MSEFKEVFDRIKSNTGLLFVNTFEEQRFFKGIVDEFKDGVVDVWSATQGLHEVQKEKRANVKLFDFIPADCRKTASGQATVGNILTALEVIETDSRTKKRDKTSLYKRRVYILRDADAFFNNPMVIRKIRDIIYLISSAGSCLVITGVGIKIPSELEKDSAVVSLVLPAFSEIKSGIIKGSIIPLINHNNEMVIKNGEPESNIMNVTFDVDKASRACCGLTEDEIINTISYSLTIKNTVDVNTILEEKRQIINKNDILTYWVCEEDLNDVGGFGTLKSWFDVQKIAMDSEDAAAFGVEKPKAALILGVQGAGKTFISKALARSWGKGLIKLDMGRVFAGLVGESEKRMRLALAQAEAAGGIVIIDEIDKGLAGAGSSDRTDGGTTKRVIGTLLTWMQEPHPGLFIVATANDISNLIEAHPELLRKGRFDEIWFADNPTAVERQQIFEIHLKKRKRDIKKFDTVKLGKICYTDSTGAEFAYVGAEIEHAIKEAISHKFAKHLTSGGTLKIGGKNDITTEDIIEQLALVKPISYVGKATVNKNRSWAKDHARNVSCESDTIEVKNSEDKGKSTRNINVRNLNL